MRENINQWCYSNSINNITYWTGIAAAAAGGSCSSSESKLLSEKYLSNRSISLSKTFSFFFSLTFYSISFSACCFFFSSLWALNLSRRKASFKNFTSSLWAFFICFSFLFSLAFAYFFLPILKKNWLRWIFNKLVNDLPGILPMKLLM